MNSIGAAKFMGDWNEAIVISGLQVAKVIFRDRDGIERPIATIKIRGFDTIIICEDDHA